MVVIWHLWNRKRRNAASKADHHELPGGEDKDVVYTGSLAPQPTYTPPQEMDGHNNSLPTARQPQELSG